MNKNTRDLVKLVQRRSGEPNSFIEAQGLIEAGADITVQINHRYLIDLVIEEEQRLRSTSSTVWKAENCQHLIHILQKQASRLLAAHILSTNTDLMAVHQLIGLHANTYQAEVYGALGLLGHLLQQDRTPISIDFVRFLIEYDPITHGGLTAENDAAETCLSIARANPKCSPAVVDYLQKTFDHILNQVPSLQPSIPISEVTDWIRRGANPEMVDEHGNTVLFHAVEMNNLDLVRTLVSYGCNTSHTNANHLTPLDLAQRARPRNPQLIAALESQNANRELQKLIATKRNQLTMDEMLAALNRGANINALIADQGSFLHWLIINQGTAMMLSAFINEFKADLSIMDGQGYRAIEKCIRTDQPPFVLLETFLTLPNITTNMFFNSKLNRTLLQFAHEHGCTNAVTVIQKALNERLWTLIVKCTGDENHIPQMIIEIKELVQYGAQVSHLHTDTQYQQWTVVHLVCQKSNKTLLQFLIEQMKANYSVANGSGDLPIAIAAERGHLSIVEYLWALPESKLNITNKDRQTPLHLAVKNQHLSVVHFLVRWGADPQASDSRQKTPLDLAKAYVPNTAEQTVTAKKLVTFLEQLICPSVTTSTKSLKETPKNPNPRQDDCELVTPFPTQPIHIGDTDPERRGRKRPDFLSGTLNDQLHDAARQGDIPTAEKMLREGADIGYRKNGETAYQTALQTAHEYYARLPTTFGNHNEYQILQQRIQACQYIAETIGKIAYPKLIEAIEKSETGLVAAYHQAGAPLTPDLIYRACSSSDDNVEIIYYLSHQTLEMFQALYNFDRPESPYQTAKKKKFHRVASYIKYLLSIECTKAVKENNTGYLKQLVRAGASVDMPDTENLKEAFKHQNLEIVRILCENGAKMPQSWLESPNIFLPASEAQTMSLDLVTCINRCLLNSRLRFTSASGDLNGVIQCQRLGANIDAMNCYGSTALLCAIQHGNYFSIVHTLVSCGASILHRNPDEPMSLIDLAKSKNYDAIATCLSKELNHQFLNSIINNDETSAEQFAQLGVNFNFQDEDKRTALHYAVQHHGIELVKWLCDRGSRPMHADVHGDYPIILAAQKGDYPVVEQFILNYPGTKTHTDGAGLTALQIAKKLQYRRIVQLIETGKPVESYDENLHAQGQKHTPEQLREATKKGNVPIIREFREDRYESRDEKRQLCYQLLVIAKSNNQHQIVDILEPYYNTELKPDLPSDMSIGDSVTLKKEYKTILFGFLKGMGNVIADCPIILDPGDPQTYRSLFSGLTSKLSKRLRQLKQVKSDQDAQNVYHQDTTKMNEKLSQIGQEMQQLEETEKKTRKRMQDREQQSARQKELSALDRKTLFEENEEDERQLAILECSMAIYRREQEALLMRQTALKFMSTQPNLYLFYLTVESRLQYLFHAVVGAQSGESSTNTTMTGSPLLLAFGEVLIPIVKDALTKIVSKLDEKIQRQEWYNITTLGEIEEVNRLACDTAVMMTLYYKEQIQSIDNTQKTQAINPYSERLKEIERIFTDLPTDVVEQSPILVVAEYITAWIIDALKSDRQQINLHASLTSQLWYLIAKKDVFNYGLTSRVSNIVRIEAGQQAIPLIKTEKHANNDNSPVWIPLRHLIGCVSMIGLRGEVYQYNIAKRSPTPDLNDLNLFGYVYLSPFTDDENIVKSIVKERNMVVAVRDNGSDIVTRVDEITQLLSGVTQRIEQTDPSHEVNKIVHHVIQQLTERKTFVNGAGIKHELEKARKVLGFDVNALKEDVQKNMKYYRDSLDATHQQIQKESEKNRIIIQKENEERYNQALNKLFQKFNEQQLNIENMISQRLDRIEADMQTKMREIFEMAAVAKERSEETLERATLAAQSSERSANASDESKTYCRELLESIEEQRKSLHSIVEDCKQSVATKINELQGSYELNVREMQQRLQQDFDRTTNLKKDLVTTVKEAAKTAEDAKTSMKEMKKLTGEQLDVQKAESKKLVAEMQDGRRYCERTVQMSKELEREVERRMDRDVQELKRLNEHYRTIQKEIERLEKLIKK